MSSSLSLFLSGKDPPIHHLNNRIQNHRILCRPGDAHRRAQSSQRGTRTRSWIYEQHQTRMHVSSRAPLWLLFYCARLSDHEEIKLLPPCASSCTREFSRKYIFDPAKGISRLSFVGKLNTRRMIHKVIENFVCRVHDCVESRVRDRV